MMKAWMTLIILVTIIFTACERVSGPTNNAQQQVSGEMENQPPKLEGSTASVSVANLVIHSSNGLHTIAVEIVDTVEERAHGLMGRESLADDHGMWFVFASLVEDKFWMKDTLIPLDMMFVGSNKKIVDIVANTIPLSTELLGSKVPYQYVLEVNAGFAAAKGIAIGDTVELRVGPAE